MYKTETQRSTSIEGERRASRHYQSRFARKCLLAYERKTRKNRSQGLLSVGRGEGRGNWFQRFGVALHMRVAT